MTPSDLPPGTKVETMKMERESKWKPAANRRFGVIANVVRMAPPGFKPGYDYVHAIVRYHDGEEGCFDLHELLIIPEDTK